MEKNVLDTIVLEIHRKKTTHTSTFNVGINATHIHNFEQ